MLSAYRLQCHPMLKWADAIASSVKSVHFQVLEVKVHKFKLNSLINHNFALKESERVETKSLQRFEMILTIEPTNIIQKDVSR